MKEKSVTFCFLIKSKEKSKFLQNHRGRVTFLWRIQASSFKVIVYSLSFLLKPWQWSSGNVKQEIITRNWIALRIVEQFRTYYLRKWETFKAFCLSFHWFNELWIWALNSWIWDHMNALNFIRNKHINHTNIFNCLKMVIQAQAFIHS